MNNFAKYTIKELLSNNRITIPAIQRDYAFGRKNESEKREGFVKSLVKGLRNEGGLHLDYVYGRTENGKLILLDGQQRVTTLWLLSVYLDSKQDFLNNFTYDTRTSSREFCVSLLHNFKKDIINNIEKNSWFFNSWRYDPTIMGMVEVLKEISKQDLSQITIQYLDKITFSFLDIKDLGEPEELYLKMNSRGKPLSEWDNFKANLFQLNGITENFQNLVDVDMIEYFWKLNKENKPSENTEKSLIKLFINIIRIELILQSDKYEDVNTREKISEKFKSHWKKYVDFAAIQMFFNFIKVLDDLSIPFERFKNDKLMTDDLRGILKGTEEAELGAYETGKLAAFYLYSKYRKFDIGIDEDKENLKQTVRLMANYLDSAIRQDYNYVPQAIKKVNRVLADNSNTVFSNIEKLDDEEGMKARMGSDWLELFYEVEYNPLSSGTAKWLIEISDSQIDLAKRYYNEVFTEIFSDDGILTNKLIVDLWSYSKTNKSENLSANNILPKGSAQRDSNTWWNFFHDSKKTYVLKDLIENNYKNKFEKFPNETENWLRAWYNEAPEILQWSRRFRQDNLDFSNGNKVNRDFIVRDQINPSGYKKQLQLEVLCEKLKQKKITTIVSESTNKWDRFYLEVLNYEVRYEDFYDDDSKGAHFYIFDKNYNELGQEIFRDNGTNVAEKLLLTVNKIIELKKDSEKIINS